MTSITTSQFFGLVSLTKLDLNSNEIKDISLHFLTAVPTLSHLCINNNKLLRLNADIFGPNITLKFLDLGGNAIMNISFDLFHKILQVEFVELSFNQLAIDHPSYWNLHCFRQQAVALYSGQGVYKSTGTD